MEGLELQKIRKRLKLTQAEFAKRIGVHSNTVARWERSEVRITSAMAKLIRLVTGPHRAGGTP